MKIKKWKTIEHEIKNKTIKYESKIKKSHSFTSAKSLIYRAKRDNSVSFGALPAHWMTRVFILTETSSWYDITFMILFHGLNKKIPKGKPIGSFTLKELSRQLNSQFLLFLPVNSSFSVGLICFFGKKETFILVSFFGSTMIISSPYQLLRYN